ncbi:MAG: hypothetical protein JNM90_23805 [Burkholderiales bacterium]|nr:hypothetical protein [Burkholderiales bacterium]
MALGLVFNGAAAQPVNEGNAAREPAPQATMPVAALAPGCARPIATIMITDAPYDTPEELAGQWRSLALPVPHGLARRRVEAGGCFATLSPDPLLLTLPGAPLPEAIVRLRPAHLLLHERTLADKIDSGVRGYVESWTTWLGARTTTDGPPLLREAGLRASILCPTARRVVREIDAVDREPSAPLVQEGENTAARQNVARIERAVDLLMAETVAALRARPCLPAPEAAPPTPGSAGAPDAFAAPAEAPLRSAP